MNCAAVSASNVVSDIWHEDLRHEILRLGALVVLAVLIGAPAFAQFDLGGHWSRRSNQDDMESGPGPDPVDYLGLPLNDEGRARGLSFQYSAVSLPEHQCGYLSPFYIVLGPFGLAIDRVLDPVTARLVAWKIGGWVDRDVTTIWMDGRPHPGASAPHTSGGFTTGVWEGDTLTTYTTHMKAGMIRRNGAPLSDQATMTMHFTRHGDLLTARAMLEDPVYLSEPYVRSRVWQLDPSGQLRQRSRRPPASRSTSCRVPEAGDVFPHYLPGSNPFVNELTRYYNLPQEAVLGGAPTHVSGVPQEARGLPASGGVQAVLRLRRSRRGLHHRRQRRSAGRTITADHGDDSTAEIAELAENLSCVPSDASAVNRVLHAPRADRQVAATFVL